MPPSGKTREAFAFAGHAVAPRRLGSFSHSYFLAGTCLAQQDVISEIVIQGNRRIPAETIRARMFTKPGDVYDQAALERDFNSLWNTGYFDDLRIEREQISQRLDHLRLR